MIPTSSIYVTLAAAEAYADALNLEPERARRELCERLHNAKIQDERDDGSVKMRRRWRSSGAEVEVEVTAVHEPPLLTIVRARVRVREGARRGGRTK